MNDEADGRVVLIELDRPARVRVGGRAQVIVVGVGLLDLHTSARHNGPLRIGDGSKQ